MKRKFLAAGLASVLALSLSSCAFPSFSGDKSEKSERSSSSSSSEGLKGLFGGSSDSDEGSSSKSRRTEKSSEAGGFKEDEIYSADVKNVTPYDDTDTTDPVDVAVHFVANWVAADSSLASVTDVRAILDSVEPSSASESLNLRDGLTETAKANPKLLDELYKISPSADYFATPDSEGDEALAYLADFFFASGMKELDASSIVDSVEIDSHGVLSMDGRATIPLSIITIIGTDGEETSMSDMGLAMDSLELVKEGKEWRVAAKPFADFAATAMAS